MSYPDVALIGKMGSGKTTVAKILDAEFGYTQLHFSSTIRRVSEILWGDVERDHLQQLGIAIRKIDENVWANAVFRQIDHEDSRVVVDDCRFPNEYWGLKDRGFVIVRVECTRNERVRRLTQIGRLQDESQLEHETETALDDFEADYIIGNHGTEGELREQVAEVMYREDLRS